MREIFSDIHAKFSGAQLLFDRIEHSPFKLSNTKLGQSLMWYFLIRGALQTRVIFDDSRSKRSRIMAGVDMAATTTMGILLAVNNGFEKNSQEPKSGNQDQKSVK
jgi:hypothetical protein